ncbi:hypothetical protein FQA39_LY09553 [Lamprigera yunnana]|nr:hypothetical protein FQA39_LY09553 [Lamprigera yunnana]
MNSAIINKFEETNQKLKETNQKFEEKMLNKLEENNQKLEETRTEIRRKMDQSMEKIQRQFLTIQEKIYEKWEKKYVDFDCKIVERKEQVENISCHIDGNCKGLRDLIDVEVKINQDTVEKIQICEDLKEQKREIVNYIEKKRRKHGIQLEEEVLNKVKIIEVKKFDELLRILETHYECGRDGVRNDGNEYYNHYNNYNKRKYNHSGQGLYQENQFYHYHKNEKVKVATVKNTQSVLNLHANLVLEKEK